RRLGDQTLAEDLYQEAFLRIHRARQTYDPTRPFRSWLFGIVHNLLNDALRSRRRAPETESFDESSILPGGSRAESVALARSPEAAVDARETGQALSRA